MCSKKTFGQFSRLRFHLERDSGLANDHWDRCQDHQKTGLKLELQNYDSHGWPHESVIQNHKCFTAQRLANCHFEIVRTAIKNHHHDLRSSGTKREVLNEKLCSSETLQKVWMRRSEWKGLNEICIRFTRLPWMTSEAQSLSILFLVGRNFPLFKRNRVIKVYSLF